MTTKRVGDNRRSSGCRRKASRRGRGGVTTIVGAPFSGDIKENGVFFLPWADPFCDEAQWQWLSEVERSVFDQVPRLKKCIEVDGNSISNETNRNPNFVQIVVHRELKDLHEAIPAEMLPKDLGGMEPTIAQLNDSWREKLECYRDWFRITDSVKSDESKRIGKCRYETKETTFGNQGSFRKIEVD
ncbi:hypothetical protein AAG570_003842 [Ranatra chinensis]|uniref:Uncharacterized protein n=1 Tax=Ranatra chinensis TaxID=642074 RepID=A0ABD0Y232_9HEMI